MEFPLLLQCRVFLIRRLTGLAWRYRRRCLQVLGLQLVLLTLGLSGLSLTGLGIDYIRYFYQNDVRFLKQFA